jgi:serine/threonine protein kinase
MILPVHLRSSGAVNRFRAEAEAAASLDHECILPIYSVGEQDGSPFYSMKFAEGGPLSVTIENYRTKPHETAALIAKLARAIAYAHQRGILHRDLKPANILFDGAGKPYVSDFGLAKWLQRECDLTQTLAILGTPFYMAPEQAADSRAVGAGADVYSLGAILYQMLTGHPPVSGETAMEVSAPDESSCSPGSGDDLLKVSRERTGVALFLGRCSGRRSRTLLRRAHDPSPARWPNEPDVALDAAQPSHRWAGRRFGRARCFALGNRLARA